MRSLLKPRAMLLAVAALVAIPAVWMLASAPPASSRPALRGTTLAEPEQLPAMLPKSLPGEPVAARAVGDDAPSPSTAPQKFAVICAAGCGSASDAVVTPRAGEGASAPRPAEAVCIGGCYNEAAPAVAGIVEAAPEASAPAGIVKRPPLRRVEDKPTSSTLKRWYDRMGDQGAR